MYNYNRQRWISNSEIKKPTFPINNELLLITPMDKTLCNNEYRTQCSLLTTSPLQTLFWLTTAIFKQQYNTKINGIFNINKHNVMKWWYAASVITSVLELIFQVNTDSWWQWWAWFSPLNTTLVDEVTHVLWAGCPYYQQNSSIKPNYSLSVTYIGNNISIYMQRKECNNTPRLLYEGWKNTATKVSLKLQQFIIFFPIIQ